MLPAEERELIAARLEKKGEILGSIDALQLVLDWKLPEERWVAAKEVNLYHLGV